MATNFSRPRQSARRFGLGLLSGTAISEQDVRSTLRDNLQFRLQSLRGMAMGGSESMSPTERRRELMNRRRSVLSDFDGPMSDSGSDSGSSGSSGRRSGVGGSRSGSIGEQSRSSGSSSSDTVPADTKSMSEVDAGTKARANDRGFGN